MDLKQKRAKLIASPSSPKIFNENKVKFFVIAFVITTAAAAAVFLFINKDRKVSSASMSVPKAFASDIPGWWYQQYFGESICSHDNCKPDADPDKDGLTNQQEYYYHSNPLNAHTVGDKMSDGELVANNFDPSKPGKISFDKAASDDEIFGESLLFDQDIKSLINDQVNPKLNLPVVPDSEIIISQDNSKTAIQQYVTKSNQISSKYFPGNRDAFIRDAMNSHIQDRIDDIGSRMQKTVGDLKQLPVPSKLINVHKDLISFLTILPDVLNTPTAEQLQNDTDPVGNAWFDKTQMALKLYQKINLETSNLKQSLK